MNEKIETWKTQVERQIEDNENQLNDIYFALKKDFNSRLFVIGARIIEENERLERVLADASLIRSLKHDNSENE